MICVVKHMQVTLTETMCSQHALALTCGPCLNSAMDLACV